MIKNYKKIIKKSVLGICVLSIQALVISRLLAQGGGVNNLISAAEGSLIYSADELNKAWFKYEIKCDENVADAQLDEILNLSKVTDVDTGNIPAVARLRETQNTEQPIKIGNAAAFFRPSNSESKSKLALFKLKSDVKDVEGEVLKKAIYSYSGRSIHDKYCTISNKILYKYQSLTSQAAQEQFMKIDSWNELFNDDSVNEWKTPTEEAINIAELCYSINNNRNVFAYLSYANTYYGYFKNATTVKEKMKNLQYAHSTALWACVYSIELRCLNLELNTDFFKTDHYFALQQNCISGVQDASFDCTVKFAQDIGAMLDVRGHTDLKGIFNDSNSTLYEEDLLLNTSQEYVTSETNEEIQTSNMFQIYNTSERYAKLYFKNNVITFEIPINLPEYKELTKKMSSFKISTEEINPILTQ